MSVIRSRVTLLVLAVTALVGGLVVAAPAEAADARGTVVTGVATDLRGNPLAGVAVDFVSVDEFNFPRQVATTARDGSYRAVLAVGDYSMTVLFDGHAVNGPTSRGGYAPAYSLDAAGDPVVVTPRAGDRVRVDVALAPGAAVRGRVTTDDGRPLAGVSVDLVATGFSSPGYLFDPRWSTDAQGYWSMTGLGLRNGTSAPATFAFHTDYATGGDSPTGYPNACLGLVPAPCDRSGPTTAAAPTTLVLTAGRLTTHADIALPPAGAAHGRLTDSAGRPIAGASIVLFGPVLSHGQPQDESQGNTLRTDSQGYWSYPRLFPQAYAVCYGWYGWYGLILTSANPDGYTAECSHDSPRSAGPFAGQLYPIASGQDRRVVDSLTANGAVAGRVVDQDGKAVSGAIVRVGYLDASGKFLPYESKAKTSRTGAYRAGAVAAGTPVVCAADQHSAERCPPAPGAPVITTTVRPGETTTGVDLVLHHTS